MATGNPVTACDRPLGGDGRVQFGREGSNHPNLRRCFMGDKSPKSKERLKKQDATEKTQKKADAFTKAHPAPGTLGSKKGK